MARPLKQGLDYFPHDTDASRDEKLETMINLYGCAGHGFYFMLLERIYHNGEDLDTKQPHWFKTTSRAFRMTQKKFREMLETSLQLGLFDQKIFKDFQIISSNSAKKRKDMILSERLRWRNYKQNPEQTEEFSTEKTGEIMGEKTPEITPVFHTQIEKEIEINNKKGNRRKIENISNQVTSSFTNDINLVHRSLEDKRGYISPRYGAESKAIKDMLKAGYAPDQIMMCWVDLKKEKFWKDKELFMMTVHAQIGQWANKINKSNSGRFTNILAYHKERIDNMPLEDDTS